MILPDLPDELLLHVLSFLEPLEIALLQRTSRRLRNLGRDDELWRSRSFDQSSFFETAERLRRAQGASEDTEGRGTPSRSWRRVGVSFGPETRAGPDDFADPESTLTSGRASVKRKDDERTLILANWDPAYPNERVPWYDEYIQRYGPVAVNWFQPPRVRNGGLEDTIDARGAALYRPGDAEGCHTGQTLLSVSPLDDGSVCVWDVNGTRGKRGAIVARSSPGILFIDGPSADNSSRSKRVDSGVTECVSVDSYHHRAYFAVQSHLIEVDLQRLAVVGCESFPWSITSVSSAHPAVPVTVGTTLGIHMHDSRAGSSLSGTNDDSPGNRLDVVGAKAFYERGLRDIFRDERPAPYAPLAQPGPLSILHLERPGGTADLSDDIYVAGRFSNILHYDRRSFPSIKGSIHSGARLCSMTSLPHPYSAVDYELRRKGLLSREQVATSKAVAGGRTLVACGEYGTKGSLEMYGLRPPGAASSAVAGGLQTSTMKNRQTSSESKLLSVVNHGARLAFSDGSGLVKFFERDGFTEVRRFRIGHCETGQPPSIFASMPGSDDIARKLLATQSGGDGDGVNNNNLVFWTGERLGLIGFSCEPSSTADDFEEKAKTAEEAAREREERAYSDMMRQALERQADDVRFVQNLGLGGGPAL